MLYPGNPIKSLVMDYIAHESFSTAKNIIEIIRKTKNISLQTIYNNLNSLVKEKILIKNRSYYSFTLNFLDKLEEFNTNLHKRTKHIEGLKNFLQNLEGRGYIKQDFVTLEQSLGFIIDFFNFLVTDKNVLFTEKDNNTDVVQFVYNGYKAKFDLTKTKFKNLKKVIKYLKYTYLPNQIRIERNGV